LRWLPAARADASDIDAVKAGVAKTVQSFGRLDSLVNNAGMMIVKPVNALSLDDFDRIVAVNVKGLFVATQEAVRHMGEGGRMINSGSINRDHSELDYRSGQSCRWGPEYGVGVVLHFSTYSGSIPPTE
jgi:NAD(P)-dependent dehydrogenase (short-subunit alcohol dehydrogenase family)